MILLTFQRELCSQQLYAVNNYIAQSWYTDNCRCHLLLSLNVYAVNNFQRRRKIFPGLMEVRFRIYLSATLQQNYLNIFKTFNIQRQQ